MIARLLILAGSSSEGLIRVKEKERFESSPTDFSVCGGIGRHKGLK